MPKLKPYDLKLFFSNRYTYAQIVRNIDGHIVASASTIEKGLRDQQHSGADKEVSTGSFGSYSPSQGSAGSVLITVPFFFGCSVVSDGSVPEIAADNGFDVLCRPAPEWASCWQSGRPRSR